MKHRITKFYFLTAFIFTLGACCKGDIIDPTYEERRNTIVGTWDVVEVSEYILADSIIEISNFYEISFNADGSGTTKYYTITQNFDWVFQLNPESIALKNILNNTSSGLFPVFPAYIYTILKNEQDRQIWTRALTNQANYPEALDAKVTWKMDRKN
ncbi:MAG: hypothetical protein R2798_03690 [Chitinophagales bacterium]|nr:hypothetical protein [Bacteroidota bacterium]MCB9043086.1 hypothetical protein [Chitinophagales bacterium]